MKELSPRFLNLCAILLIALLCGTHTAAADSPSAPRVSLGIGGTYGISDVYDPAGGAGDLEEARFAGGGIIIEHLWSGRLGIHTGLWYTRSTYTYEENMKARGNAINLPLYCLLSFRGSRLALELMAGFKFMYLFDIEYTNRNTGSTIDVTNFVNYEQVTVDGGFSVKFALTRFVDVFVSLIGEFALTSFSNMSAGGYDRLYGAGVQSGVLFRTF